MAGRGPFLYSAIFFHRLRHSAPPVGPELKSQLRQLGLLRLRCRPRGTRAGRNFVRSISTVVGYRPTFPGLDSTFTCKSNGQKCGNQQPLWNRRNAVSSNLIMVPVEQNKKTKCTRQTHMLPSVFMCNARSLSNKLDEFETTIKQMNASIAVVTETWYTPEMDNTFLNIDNYNLFSRCRTDKRGGGVAVYVKSDIQARLISQISVPPELECIWVWLRPTRLPRQVPSIALCAIYIPPASEHQELLVDHLIQTSDRLKIQYPDVGLMLMGDLNRTDYKSLMLSHKFDQVVTTPTRGDAVLDVILTYNLKRYYETPEVTNPIGRSDHCAVWWHPRGIPRKHNKARTVVTRPMPDSKVREFGQWIVSHEWTEVLTMDSVDSKTEAFYNTLGEAIDKYFPQKRTKVHNNDKPWITTAVKALLKKRQEAYTLGQCHLYKFLRNKVARVISTCKENYYADHIKHLKNTNPAQWHRRIRHMGSWSRPSSVIHVPGVKPADSTGTAQAINKHLATICQALPPLDYSKLPSYLPSLPPPQINPWEMYRCLQRVKTSKAPGPDLLPPKLIKEFAYELSHPLTDILNTSLREGRVPEMWRDATVIPVPKEYPADLNKIRPISLTAQLAKICEGFVTTWIFSDILPRVDSKQFGNMKGCSTTHCLVDLLNFFYEGGERKGTVGTLILTDFSKAFDSVCHTTAINKLITMGARASLIPWICSFLSNRRQRVRYQDSVSDWETLTSGVAQGTLLGPLVFLAMINDAGPSTNNPHWKYVDDLNLGEVRPVSAPTNLQSDLNNLDTWSETNSMSLNPKKCKAMYFCFMRTPPEMPPLTLGGQTLSIVKQAKLLGLHIRSDLRWSDQVDAMVTKGSRRLFFLKRLRRAGVPLPDLITVYCGYIRPTLEYATPCWNAGLTRRESDRIERVQKRACRVMLGRQYLSYSDALLTLDLQSLSQRRLTLCQDFALAVTKAGRHAPWLPPARNPSHHMQLRHTRQYKLPTGTKRYLSSPVPTILNLLNAL